MATLACARATPPRTPSTRASLQSRASPRGIPGPRRVSWATTNAVSPSEYDDALLVAELESLVEDTRVAGCDAHTHVVAFSGGVDSSLCAYLVHRAFGGDRRRHESDARKNTADATRIVYAAVGVSPSLPSSQLTVARRVAKAIGIPLREVPTDEGASAAYVANEGESCLHCKNELYTTLRAVALDAEKARTAKKLAGSGRLSNDETTLAVPSTDASCSENVFLKRHDVCVYNGTNFDDRADDTRLGLRSAAAHGVASPLFNTPKTRVRELARVAGLPNWNLAAAPCLRSRLAFGVPALARTLADVEAAEEAVRAILRVQPEENMRVRVLSEEEKEGAGEAEEEREKLLASAATTGAKKSGKERRRKKGKPAALELDPHHVRAVERDTGLRESLREALARCGFEIAETRAFASGSVARLPPRREEKA